MSKHQKVYKKLRHYVNKQNARYFTIRFFGLLELGLVVVLCFIAVSSMAPPDHIDHVIP